MDLSEGFELAVYNLHVLLSLASEDAEALVVEGDEMGLEGELYRGDELVLYSFANGWLLVERVID